MSDEFITGRNQFTADDIFARQRTERGQRSERLLEAIRNLDKNDRARLNAEILQIRSGIGVSPSSVHSNTILSTMSTQYANDDFIGEQLMPSLAVDKRSDSYAIYPKRERLAYPDDAMGPKGQANELDESRTTDNYSVRDYGFKNFVDAETIDNQDGAFDEMADLVEAILEGIAFRREKRIATVLTTGSNYSGNTVALAGADRWDSGGGGDPVKAIQDAKAAIWSGRGRSDLLAFTNLETFNVLSRHQAIRDLFKYTGSGLATPDLIAGYFGFAKLLVAAPREDTANSGQTASYSRIWNKSFGIVRVARRPSKRNAVFGYTFRLNGDPTTTQWFDPVAGKKGGYWAKVATSEDHKVVAGDTGYLITTPIS